MAKIKLRIGDNEIEIDSRDFYVDNNTIRKVIEDISTLLQESSARIMPYPNEPSLEENNALDSLENAEVYEPEFGEPVFLPIKELRGKLRLWELLMTGQTDSIPVSVGGRYQLIWGVQDHSAPGCPSLFRN